MHSDSAITYNQKVYWTSTKISELLRNSRNFSETQKLKFSKILPTLIKLPRVSITFPNDFHSFRDLPRSSAHCLELNELTGCSVNLYIKYFTSSLYFTKFQQNSRCIQKVSTTNFILCQETLCTFYRLSELRTILAIFSHLQQSFRKIDQYRITSINLPEVS